MSILSVSGKYSVSTKNILEDAWDWARDTWNDIVGTAEDTSESVAIPSAATGCGRTGLLIDERTDVELPWNMTPPDADEDSDIPEISTGDAGELILTDEIFDVAFNEGPGVFFQESPEIILESGDITGSGLRNMDLYIEIGTDSTLIPVMPQDNPDTPDINENALACFDGLISTNQLSEEDRAAGIIGCPETGYESFVFCPSESSNRIPIYLAGYTLVGRGYEEVYEESFASDADLYVHPELGILIGVLCGDNPTPYEITIPREFYHYGYLNAELRLKLVIDARNAIESHNYEARMHVRIKARE